MAETDVREPDSAPMFASIEEAQEAYKKLQRNLNKAQSVARETMLNRFVVDDLQGRIDELTETVRASRPSDAYADDEDDPFKKLDTSRALRAQGSQARAEISSILLDTGEDFTDPKFKEASALYKEGRWTAAVEATRKAVVGDAGTPDDIQAQVDAKVTEALRKRGIVDSGGHSSDTSAIPNDPEQLRAKLKDRKWVSAHKTELLEAARRGQLK